jgi:hypothetical protein
VLFLCMAVILLGILRKPGNHRLTTSPRHMATWFLFLFTRTPIFYYYLLLFFFHFKHLYFYWDRAPYTNHGYKWVCQGCNSTNISSIAANKPKETDEKGIKIVWIKKNWLFFFWIAFSLFSILSAFSSHLNLYSIWS